MAIDETIPTPPAHPVEAEVDIRALLARLPEDARPPLLSEPADPDPSVANLAPEIEDIQPLNRVGDSIRVVFAKIPTQMKVDEVKDRLGAFVTVVLEDPDAEGVFEATRQNALALRKGTVGFVEAVLGVAAQAGASDLRIGVGDLPIVKIGGVGWRRLSEFDPVTSEQAEATAIWAAHRPLDEEDFEDMDVDAAATFVAAHGQYRLRANVYRERRGWAVSLRFIPDQPPALESLGLPAIVESFADLERGLVLITGVTGSGKSTTLAGIIDRINGRHAVAVQTIENPVEYLHTSRKASIHQREVGTDTDGFATAMRSAMRQNPDIVLVGEIRDYEEISTAVTLAETGHLVFATLHTSSAAETITRLVNVFPSEGQNQIRTQLSMVLKAVVCQHLFPRQDDPNKGCVVAEIMLTNDSLATLIRSGSTDKLTTYILDGRQEGMQHMDEALADAVLDGRIAEAAALPWVTREQQFQQRMRNQRR